MATDFLRDGLFLVAWFGLMTCVWLGWAQEAPPKRAVGWLGLGSVLGTAAAAAGGYAVWAHWDGASALEGRFAWFGVLVGAEVVAAAVACLVLWRQGRARWFSFAVALVVAAHFVPLAVLLQDWALAILGVLQFALVVAAARFARRWSLTPSFPIGVAMGSTLLLASGLAALWWLPAGLA
ncbi:hypothetical protein B1813_14480 [Saccharomonospora piscinae]|uniref:Uncharacterized protein n=1 Tax=Saccharomonospora piscinae TaxID=687388 RepID=A0A1V9A1B9_SACPI|nr:hypothetical protein [Saccharomonospora piscinae]OQO90744.1 hypothetical protein B1813_14480 [Saccharomonospora piscinae]TLW93416.1 hypothetical protein FFT09_08425 [Saccharomonospora piscinae]